MESASSRLGELEKSYSDLAQLLGMPQPKLVSAYLPFQVASSSLFSPLSREVAAPSHQREIHCPVGPARSAGPSFVSVRCLVAAGPRQNSPRFIYVLSTRQACFTYPIVAAPKPWRPWRLHAAICEDMIITSSGELLALLLQCHDL